MQMVIAWTSVTCIADVADCLAAPGEMSFSEIVGVAVEVRVVVNGFFVLVQLVDGDATAFAVEEFDDPPVSRSKHGRAARSRDVNRVVHAPFGTCVRIGVLQLLWTHSGNRNKQRGRTAELSG